MFLGLDHRAGHFRPLRIIAQVIGPIVLLAVRCFCVVQKQKGVAGAMIEACFWLLVALQEARLSLKQFVVAYSHFSPLQRRAVRSPAVGDVAGRGAGARGAAVAECGAA